VKRNSTVVGLSYAAGIEVVVDDGQLDQLALRLTLPLVGDAA
jgi:hypothetical protein